MRYLVVLFVIFAAVFVQGHPGIVNQSLLDAITSGDWETAHEIIFKNGIQAVDGSWVPLPTGSVKDLKPIPGGHVYGESEFTFHESSNINGQKTEQSGGHKVINDDGKVSEYDFKPQITP